MDSIDDPVSHRDRLEAILDGLPDEYNTLASIVQYPPTMCSNIEVESMLLSHESKLEKVKKTVVTEPMSINLTQGSVPASDSHPNPVSAQNVNNNPWNAQNPNPNPNHWNENQFSGGSQFNGRHKASRGVATRIVAEEAGFLVASEFNVRSALSQGMMQAFVITDTLL